ncbi:MAG: OmpA family protein, partial [Haloferula sp.]
DLSKRRAEAVKTYLVDSIRLPKERISTRGYGKTRPLVLEGSVEEQAPNRRVEIKMRRTQAPMDEPVAAEPAPPAPKPVPPPKPVEPEPPKAVPVPEPAPRAVPVPEPAPRAVPVPEPVPRAVPVPETVPRAQPVPE